MHLSPGVLLSKRSRLRRLVALCLLSSVFCALFQLGSLHAQTPPAGTVPPISKLAPALAAVLGTSDTLVWSDPSKQTVRVLIQTYGPVSASLLTAVSQNGGKVVHQFTSINAVLVELPKKHVLDIAARADVERMSPDHLAVQSASSLEVATGADQVRKQGGLLTPYTGLDGTGVGIAILDSGIMASHSAFNGGLLSGSRVIAATDIISSNTNLSQFELKLGILNLNLTGVLSLLGLAGPVNDDGYGHGSHVAGAAAGRSLDIGSARGFDGIAPNANLIDVKVLDQLGYGQVSDVLTGIDWVIAHAKSNNIRVMNLSLAAATGESYVTDPLCRASRVAVAQGITVVAAGGNFGTNAKGVEQYGAIGSPGIDPMVITVGAANTHQTDARSDDTVTHFSLAWTDAHIHNGCKRQQAI